MSTSYNTCRFCGSKFQAGDTQCKHCGALRTKYTICEYCDTASPAHLKTCLHCNAPIKKETAQGYENDYPIGLIIASVLSVTILILWIVSGILYGRENTVKPPPVIDSPTAIIGTADDEFRQDWQTLHSFLIYNNNGSSAVWKYGQALGFMEQYRNATFESDRLKMISLSIIGALENLCKAVREIDPDPNAVEYTDRPLWLVGTAELNAAIIQYIQKDNPHWDSDIHYKWSYTRKQSALLELDIHRDLQNQLTNTQLRNDSNGPCYLEYINNTDADVAITFSVSYTLSGESFSESCSCDTLYPGDSVKIVLHSPIDRTTVENISWTLDSISINGEAPEDYFWPAS